MKWIILIILVLFDLNSAKFSPKDKWKRSKCSCEVLSTSVRSEDVSLLSGYSPEADWSVIKDF